MDRFTDQQLTDCLERLSPEAGDRLGWYKRSEDEGWYKAHPTPVWAKNVTYSDHAAMLAEVLIDLARRGWVISWDYGNFDLSILRLGTTGHSKRSSPSLFTAAHAAFMEVCDGK